MRKQSAEIDRRDGRHQGRDFSTSQQYQSTLAIEFEQKGANMVIWVVWGEMIHFSVLSRSVRFSLLTYIMQGHHANCILPFGATSAESYTGFCDPCIEFIVDHNIVGQCATKVGELVDMFRRWFGLRTFSCGCLMSYFCHLFKRVGESGGRPSRVKTPLELSANSGVTG